MAPNLRRIGIEVTEARVGKQRCRIITLEHRGEFASAPSAPSAGPRGDDPTGEPTTPCDEPTAAESPDNALDTSVRHPSAEDDFRPPDEMNSGAADRTLPRRTEGGHNNEEVPSVKNPLDHNDLRQETTKADEADGKKQSRSGSFDGGIYRLVTTDADHGTALASIDESVLVAIDTETTGLNPRTDRVRLRVSPPTRTSSST